MAGYILKNIPDDIYQRARAAAENSFRWLNQEIIYRLRHSFDTEEVRLSAVHAKWVMEAFASGPAQPLKPGQLEAAFKRGIKRSQAHKESK